MPFQYNKKKKLQESDNEKELQTNSNTIKLSYNLKNYEIKSRTPSQDNLSEDSFIIVHDTLKVNYILKEFFETHIIIHL